VTTLFVLQSTFADLIVNLRNTSSQVIKKQGDSGHSFGKRNATYVAGNTIDRDLPYKINKNNDYSPTNSCLFSLLKLLTTDL
jgi:hypothetical protein